MRFLFTLIVIFSFITSGYSDPKKPKPKKCTVYSCTDYDWAHNIGRFDPTSIEWPLHYTGEVFLDRIDGGDIDIEVAFTRGYRKYRVPLREFRKDAYYKDPWFLDKGIYMNQPFVCEAIPKDEVRFKSGSCSQVLSSFEDLELFGQGGSCKKIVRDWLVVDWCEYEPNTVANTKQERYVLVHDLDYHSSYFAYGKGAYDVERDGWYTFRQVINVLDEDPPELASCDDITLELENACSTKVQLKNRASDTGKCPSDEILVELEVSKYEDHKQVVLTKWLRVLNDKEFTIDLGYLEKGEYHIDWQLGDGCNNKSVCSQKLIILDKNPPNIICIQNLSTSISDKHGASIWAADFVHKVEGPCHDGDLTFSFSPDEVVPNMTFNCPDGIGLNEFEVYVSGKNGVQASCNVSLFVADHADCDPGFMQIAGFVTDRYYEPLVGASISVMDQGELVAEGSSNESGVYGVDRISRSLESPVIMGSFEDPDAAKGIDPRDMIQVLRQVMGIEDLPTAEAQAAADVDSDGDIDIDDYWGLAEIIYDVPNYELEYDPWKFYYDKIRFAGLQASRLVSPIKLRQSLQQYSLIGIKTGDVDFSWRPGETASGRSSKKISSFSSDGDLLVIQVPTAHHTYSLSLQGEIDPGDVAEAYTADGLDVVYRVVAGESSDELVILSTQDLTGQKLFVRLTGQSRLNQRGSIFTGDVKQGILVSDWTLERQVGENGLSSLLASPNPFDQNFTLTGSYDQSESIVMNIYTTSGQLVKSESILLSTGYNIERIDAGNLNPGVYLVELKNESSSVMHKMIKQ